MKWLLPLVSLVCLVAASVAAEETGQDKILGRKVNNFELKDYRGKTHSLSDYAENPIVVVYFMGTECPLAKLYGPRVQKLADELEAQGVAFLGVSSNVQDSITELAAHARIHEIRFPLLKDLGNKVADAFQATRTPQVFVLDQDRRIRYHGRIDAQFTFGVGVGLARPQAQRRDLAIAVEELLAGKPVSVAATEAKGCLIGRARSPKDKAEVTYSRQISRLLQDRCITCHREGQIAPFAMTSYEEVAGWGEMIAEVVRQQRMPPWHANPAHGDFSNANVLSAEEKRMIYQWVDDGCPEGDAGDLPAPRKVEDRWFLPRRPDKVVYLGDEPVSIKAEGIEPYRHFVVDPQFAEDKWVQMAECRPGNPAVVHHIIVYIQPPKQPGQEDKRQDRRATGNFRFLAGFAPGTRPLVAPPGWAKKIPAGSKFVFEMHYTPIGSPQQDRSSVALLFMDKKDVTHQMATFHAINQEFEIPPLAANHQVEARKTFERDVTLLSLFPHMHMRGKSFRYELTYPDGKQEILLDVPQYDFNWQNSYIFAKPKLIPQGSKLHCTALFDNSEENLANPDPNQTVRWGEQTWEEMMIGWGDIGVPIAAEASSPTVNKN